MASRKTFFLSKPSYMYPTSESSNPSTSTDHFELDEADLWSSFNEITLEGKKQQLPTSRSSKKHTRGGDWSSRVAAAASSVPVNVPDWSKILKGEYRDHKNRDSDDDGDADDGDDKDHDGRVPPHEYLARRRGASFSVHEGIGRTLKGRDLRQVRNAIWKKTGFED